MKIELEDIILPLVYLSFLPMGVFLLLAYWFDYSFFLSFVKFPDSHYYIEMARNISADVELPFRSRVVVPILISILHFMTGSNDYYVTFFVFNLFIMGLISFPLYAIFEGYTTEKWAILGVWVHNLSFPVVWYFYSALADTLAYLILLILILMIQNEKSDYQVFLIFLFSLLVKETCLIVVPYWLFVKWREYKKTDDRETLEMVIIFVFLLGLYFLFCYGFYNKTSFNPPNPLWWVYVLLCLVPFVPFLWGWKMKKEDIVYSVTIIFYSVYAMFFASFDGRFLVLGYPIWIGYSLDALRRGLLSMSDKLNGWDDARSLYGHEEDI
jgi:hypothetical protein